MNDRLEILRDSVRLAIYNLNEQIDEGEEWLASPVAKLLDEHQRRKEGQRVAALKMRREDARNLLWQLERASAVRFAYTDPKEKP